MAVVAAVVLAGSMGSAWASPADGVRGDIVASSVPWAAKAPERIENLRLQRIPSGSLRGRLVVAGRLDHLPADGVVREVVIRMTMTVPRSDGGRRTVGRKVLHYRLPAGVSPQDMTLRWLMDKPESRLVDRAGDAARLTVVVRESRAGGPMARHVKVAERLRVEPLAPLPSFTTSARSTGVFIPAGYYSSLSGYHLWTAEDASGAPYVGGIGLGGGKDTYVTWFLMPLWILQGSTAGSPGPGNGYLYLDKSLPSWSLSTSCPKGPSVTAGASGTFSQGSAFMSWEGPVCSGIDYEVRELPPGSQSLNAS